MLTEFRTLCVTGVTSPAAVLAKADAGGWVKAQPPGVEEWDLSRDRARAVGSMTLILDVWAIDENTAHGDTCVIAAKAQATGWTKAMRDWLGIAPSQTTRQVSLFQAIRTDDGWRSEGPADLPALDRLKAEGRFYAFMAADGVWVGEDRPSAMLMVTHPRRPGN